MNIHQGPAPRLVEPGQEGLGRASHAEDKAQVSTDTSLSILLSTHSHGHGASTGASPSFPQAGVCAQQPRPTGGGTNKEKSQSHCVGPELMREGDTSHME